MNGDNDGMVLEEGGEILYSDPKEREWQRKMEEAGKRADKLYPEDKEDED